MNTNISRNELVASIMLEAAELLKNDTLNEAGARDKYLKMLADKQDKIKKEIALEEKKIDFGKKDTGKLKSLKNEYEKIKDDASKYSARVHYGYEGDHGKDLRKIINNKDRMHKMDVSDIYFNKQFKDNFSGKKGSELQQRITKRGERQKALKEAVDLLYERAVLCEDAEEASAYVEKAEELQKAIEDIPEETPVKQDEYNTSVVGGDDEKPELEEIKDLCDNDPEVIKLLTDDEDKSVTVNESIFNFYDI